MLAQFDVLLLVKPPGELAFYGPFNGAAEFFRGLPSRFPKQLGDIRVPTPQHGDNLADIVLGALKVVAKRETNGASANGSNGRERNESIAADAAAAPSQLLSDHEAPFNCRDAFLHSPYARPLMRALVSLHGEGAAKQFALPLSQKRNQSPASAAEAEKKESEHEFTIPLPPKLSSTTAPSSPIALSSSDASAFPPTPSWWPLFLCFRELMRRFFLSTIRAHRSFFLRFFTCLVYGFVTVSQAGTLSDRQEWC